jgi:hypothetical protein
MRYTVEYGTLHLVQGKHTPSDPWSNLKIILSLCYNNCIP